MLDFQIKNAKRIFTYWRGRKKYGGAALAQPLEQLGVRIIETAGAQTEPQLVTLPANYFDLLDQVHEEIKKRIDIPAHCHFVSEDATVDKKLNSGNIEQNRTQDMPEIQNGQVSNIKLKKTLDLPGLEALCQNILPQLEKTIFGSHIIVEHPIVFRRIPCHFNEARATLWHSDNHYEGVIKIMIYLNDVDENCAPFEYLRHAQTGKTVRVRAGMPPKYRQSRVPPDVMERYFQSGYENHKVLGPRGTMVVFDDKIIHKGNKALTDKRDVLILQVSPVAFRPERYIDERWTKPVIGY